MKYLKSKDWWEKAGVRALKTVCQTAIGVIGSSVLISSVDWITVVSGAALAGLLSMLTSLAGIPEMETENVQRIRIK